MHIIKDVLMYRDKMTSDEADGAIETAKNEMQECLANGDMDAAENICMEHFGLEPDYIMELI